MNVALCGISVRGEQKVNCIAETLLYAASLWLGIDTERCVFSTIYVECPLSQTDLTNLRVPERGRRLSLFYH